MSILTIGDGIIQLSDILEVSDRKMSVTVTEYKKNPEPKPEKGFFKKLLYSERISYQKTYSFSCVVIKVKDGVQAYTDSNGYHSYQRYTFYTIYHDKDFKKYAKILGNSDDPNIIEKLCNIGMDRGLGYWLVPDYLDTHMKYDPTIKNKSDFINKYFNG